MIILSETLPEAVIIKLSDCVSEFLKSKNIGNIFMLPGGGSYASCKDGQLADADEPGGESLPVISVDEYIIGCKPPTFLRLDIEKFEKSAILGTANLIARHKPILAASSYNYPEDLWEIPNLIHNLNLDYDPFIRYQTHEIHDTVRYAIPMWKMKT